MLIVCPTCATTFQIELAALGAAGRNVRCSSCKETWFATPDSVVEEAALMPAMTGDSEPSWSVPEKPQRANAPAARADEFSIDTPPADDMAADESAQALTVTDAPPLAPQAEPEPSEAEVAKVDPGTPEDIETIAARRARQRSAEREEQRPLWRRIASLPMLIVTLLAILGAVLQWRVPMVRHFPQAASLYAAIGMPVNLRGLIFENVKTTTEFVDGVMVLVIEGTVVNLTRNTLEVPRLRFVLRNSAGLEVYAWTALPSKTLLTSGHELPFRTRLASPPPDGRDVIVRFFNRRDVVAGSP
jgi:predicted Zn finger-like uncharacterized protein